jgi:hypothetical protein
MIKQAGMAVAALLVLTCAGFGQDGRWNVSINAIGTLSKQSSGNQVVLTPTQGYGVVGSAEFRLAPKFSLQASAGHMDNSQKYATSSANYRVLSTLTEFSGALVVRPFETKNWKPFVFGGAGTLVFNPTTTTVIVPNPPLTPTELLTDIGATRQTQVAILYGGGVDHPLPVLKFISLRLQYRGLFYSAPSFQVPILFTGQRGHIAEPSIGIVVNF